jgi:SAM-dependent MidA family methyltransferase
MWQVLTNPDGGYYTTRGRDTEIFGTKGDFITSPEISQVFGELVGIWTVAEWMAQGQVSGGVELIEVGPGKGTLMADILRTIRNFKAFSSNIEAVYLVEASSSLREVQKQLLCGDAIIEKTDIGYRSISKYLGVPIMWVEDIRLLPRTDKTPFIFAHEFFDALPIYAFQSVAPLRASQPTTQLMTPTGPTTLHNSKKVSETPQWRELMVSLNPRSVVESRKDEPEFQLSVASAATPSCLLLPEISQRYKALKSHPGSIIEVSPESRIIVAEFARRIGGSPGTSARASRGSPRSNQSVKRKASGAAFILDYGPASTIPLNSLRGIRQHAKVSPFSFPGQVDVSADVDFTGLAEAAIEANEGVEVHGPVEQGDFLMSMGIVERAEQLLKNVQDDEKRRILETGWRRLIDKGVGGMGKLYKVLAIVPENEGRRRPVGFGGIVK